MDTNEHYRKIICNPYSWKYVSENLFSAAIDLCDLYQRRLAAERRYFRRQIKVKNKRLVAENKRLEAELEQLKAELEQLKTGKINDPDSELLSKGQSHLAGFATVGMSQDCSKGLTGIFSKSSFIFQGLSMVGSGKMMPCDDYPKNLKHYLHLLPVYMMLMGMAVEDLAKGIKVARKLKEDNTIVNRATLKILGINGHVAPDLIEGLGISLDDDEKKLLSDINEHLEWSGRYSAPSNQYKPVLSERIENMTLVEIEEEKVFEVLAGLYERLMDVFDMEAEDPFIKNLPWWECTRF